MKNIICGKNSVFDAIENKFVISKIYVLKGSNFTFPKSIKIEFKTPQELTKITDLNHQGIIAFISSFPYKNMEFILKHRPSKILVLDHIQDSFNLGAIMRSANAFGFTNIIISNKRTCDVNATAIKVSSGGFVNLNIVKVNSLVSTIKKLKENDYWIYASSLNKASEISVVQFHKPMVIIVGNEQKGVSQSLLKMANERFFINMVGSIQSLNVSVAAGIIMSKITQNK